MRRMFVQELEEVIGEEPVVGMVIGESMREAPQAVEQQLELGSVICWDKARPYLDYEHDAGYGATDCHPVFIWTPTRVIFVQQYDGATSVQAIPRHPTPCEPYMPGGG